MTAEVGDNTNAAEAQQILAESSGVAAQAVCDANGIDAELRKLESGEVDDANSAPSYAKGNVEAGVYGDIGLDAVTGGSATIELAQMGAQIIGESFDKSLGGMEKPVKAPISECSNVRSIHTKFFNDVAGRSKGISDFMSGEDKVKGVKANETSITALMKTRDALNVLQAQATLTAGNAINHGAKLGGQTLQAQQMGGMAPGGNAPQLALDSRAPKPPTDDMFDETGAA